MSSTPSNALTVPSTAMTPSTAPSGGGAPTSISNTPDGTVELNLGGWIARSSQSDVLGLITAHTLKNCPNNHCPFSHASGSPCDCNCQVQSSDTCLQCPKLIEHIMRKLEFTTKDAQRVLYCGANHTDSSRRSMQSALRCFSCTPTTGAVVSQQQSDGRTALTFDQFIETLRAQGMTRGLTDDKVAYIRSLN